MDVFYVALDKLIQEINTRFQRAEKINNMFSFVWNPSTSDAESSVAKAIELSEFYYCDLNTRDFAEETRHLTRVGMPLFGKVSSLELLKQDLSARTPEHLSSNLCCIEGFHCHPFVSC